MFWIKDMSIPDPYYVLPLIMGVTMFAQQKLSPAPPDPIQAKVMMSLPIVFTFMFLWFPAGLVLYWVVNNMLSIAQQWVITKRVESGADAAAVKARTASPGTGLGAWLSKQVERGRSKLMEQGRGKLVDLIKKPSSGQGPGKRRK
ncbi:MAG: YidC/Oxa1 family membrane protein insertase, partial [Candidatus Competibacteraceae bacterium]|nr:YidC/Oxa1 family membrane protein insertase [Candidatus Competibacteraceae bacterium]